MKTPQFHLNPSTRSLISHSIQEHIFIVTFHYLPWQLTFAQESGFIWPQISENNIFEAFDGESEMNLQRTIWDKTYLNLFYAEFSLQFPQWE